MVALLSCTQLSYRQRGGVPCRPSPPPPGAPLTPRVLSTTKTTCEGSRSDLHSNRAAVSGHTGGGCGGRYLLNLILTVNANARRNKSGNYRQRLFRVRPPQPIAPKGTDSSSGSFQRLLRCMRPSGSPQTLKVSRGHRCHRRERVRWARKSPTRSASKNTICHRQVRTTHRIANRSHHIVHRSLQVRAPRPNASVSRH